MAFDSCSNRLRGSIPTFFVVADRLLESLSIDSKDRSLPALRAPQPALSAAGIGEDITARVVDLLPLDVRGFAVRKVVYAASDLLSEVFVIGGRLDGHLHY